MCADPELTERAGMNEIVRLEQCVPGSIHPENWTLRETCVRKFKRAAAGNILDLPFRIRPPKVLERTCAFLEEVSERVLMKTRNICEPLLD